MNYLETIKNITKNKKTENLIFLLVLFVVLLFSCTYIFSNNKKTVQTINSNISEEKDLENINEMERMEEKLEEILSQISGISEVSVALTCSNDGNNTPIYNTRETINQTQTTTEKNVAYNEQNGTKMAVIATKTFPSIEGAIVVAKGAKNVDIKSKIANAVAVSVGIPIYKVQVFEKE